MDLHFAQKFCIFVVQKWRYLGRTGYLHYFYTIFHLKIGEITRRIRKIIRRKGKIFSNLVKIVSILGARMSVINSKTSGMNVKFS